MKVNVESAGACRNVMSVDVAPDGVQEDYRTILKAYTSAAKLPGFRKGKAPVHLVEQRYKSEIEEDARERLVPKFYHEALAQEGIEPVSIVDVGDISFSKEDGLQFRVTLDVAPTFKLPKYQRISVKARKTEPVTDNDVDEQVNHLRERFARFEDVADDRPAHKGDLVCIDYKGSCDGTPLGELSEEAGTIGEGTDFWALLDEPEFLPGLVDHLSGTAIGESKTASVAFPADYRIADVAGRTADYEFSVKGIRERVLPNIDEEFLKPLGEESEETLRTRIREQLEANVEREAEHHLRNEISQYLLAKTKFDMPQSVIDQETNLMARNLVQRIAQQGATEEQIREQKDTILSEAAKSSHDRVKLRYILNRIAEEEDLHCNDEELDQRLAAMAAQYRMTPEQLKSELEKRNGIESVRSDIRTEKAMDFLREHAKVK